MWDQPAKSTETSTPLDFGHLHVCRLREEQIPEVVPGQLLFVTRQCWSPRPSSLSNKAIP